MARTQGGSPASAVFVYYLYQPLVSFGLIRTSIVIKHSHLTTEHREHPQEGIHLRYNKNIDHIPGLACGEPSQHLQSLTGGSQLASGGSGFAVL